MYSIILPLWEKRCQIIVAAAASPAVVEAVFAAGRNLVWADLVPRQEADCRLYDAERSIFQIIGGSWHSAGAGGRRS